MKNCVFNMIFDVSGSMNEMGKIHIQRNLFRYASQINIIDQKKYSGINFCFYKWGQEVSRLECQKDCDVRQLTADGTSSLKALISFLSQSLTDTVDMRNLILSDGLHPNVDVSSFQKYLISNPNVNIRTVAIGADADLVKLKEISSNKRVYLAEDIASAIRSVIYTNNDEIVIPDSLSHTISNKTEELGS